MIFLSFDIEEFDNPFPCSQQLSFEQQMEISVSGTQRILDLLAAHQITATFFCTANFASHASELIARMVSEGHEVASHGYFHNRFEPIHLRQSREALESLTGCPVTGFRMPNMGAVSVADLADAGYAYNSSLHPTYLPGKYNNFTKPRSVYKEGDVYQIPASVSPVVRLPLFWLALHNYPLAFYKMVAKAALKKDGYLNLYFHPWEFVELQQSGLDLPWYVKRNSGDAMCARLGSLIDCFKSVNQSFRHLNECAGIFGDH